MSSTVHGFEPFYSSDSKVLILGSFPSVKSREQSFYYGNPRNAFWRILANFFGEETPLALPDKKDFLIRRKVALWDIVTECEIVASRDETIKNFKVANLNIVLQNCALSCIIVNGGRAYDIFARNYGELKLPVYKLPSTSPANARRNNDEWYAALRRAFEGT